MSQVVIERRMPAVLRGDPVEGPEAAGIDPALAEAVRADHREDVFLPVVEAHRGRPREAASLSAAFDTAVDALSCALAVQSRTAEWNAGLPEDCRPLFRWTVTRDGEAPGAAPPCEPGGLAVSPSVAAEVEATDQLLPPRDEVEKTAFPSDATVFAAASPAVAGTARSSAGAPAAEMPGVGVQPGGLLNGTYEVTELLASGGMGEVFRGREVHSGGEVAVKVIRLDMVHHPSALSLFQKEALVLRDINHDAIVRYYSFSFDPVLKRHYLVMEFVDGPPLSRVLEGGGMAAEAVALLGRRVASGLQLAHEHGIVHRDLSPDNIILPHGDPARAKIIDFGIARAAQIGGGTIINGGFAGKHSYVSPEHLGLAGGEVTAKSDIYSLGIVLAEACLGRQLDMAGTHVEVIEKRRKVPDLSEVDPRLRDLIARMLDPDPERRPDSMTAVAEAAHAPVELPSAGDPPQVRPFRLSVEASIPAGSAPPPVVRPPTSPPRPRRPERWIAAGALVAALALGAGLFGYASLSGGPSAAPKQQATLQSGSESAEAPSTPSPAAPSGTAAIEPPPQVLAPPPSQAQTPVAPPPVTSPAKAEPPPQPAAAPPSQPATAAVPPSAPPAAGTDAVPSMAEFVRSYDGGPCFFARPVRLSSTSAALDAFAVSPDAFDKLDRSFQDRFAVSPDIVGRVVWSRQCPALDFLRQTTRTGVSAPQLFLKSKRVGKGQLLDGEIRGLDGRAVALLLIGENGGVRDVTGTLKPDGNAMTFQLAAEPEAGGPAPELLVAVASRNPLPSLGRGAPTTADAAFRTLLEGTAHQGMPLAADAERFVVGG